MPEKIPKTCWFVNTFLFEKDSRQAGMTRNGWIPVPAYRQAGSQE